VTLTDPRPRIPASVFLLAIGIFCLGTSEFMIAGLLPQISEDLQITIPEAGLLITGFAVGMIVGAPVMALASLKLPSKTTLIVIAVLFALGHVLAVVTDQYAVVMISRVISAVMCGGFWAIGAVTTVRVSSPAATGRALAVLTGGLTASNLLGVPAGTWLGEQYGWRAAFWAIVALSVLVAIMIALFVPASPSSAREVRLGDLVRRELRVFAKGRVWLALATTALFQAAMFCAFSYFAPLLIDVTGLGSELVPVVLVLFGVGSLVGIVLGSRIVDRHLFGNILGSLAALIVALVFLAIVAGIPQLAVVAIALVGVAGFSIAGALNARIFGVAGDAATLASSVNVSAFNVGNAIGPWVGGLVISAGLGYRAPVWMAVAFAVAALVVALVALRADSRRSAVALALVAAQGSARV
jgi:DHA1 family chloramphenicol resistance protein-like MFS transporter